MQVSENQDSKGLRRARAFLWGSELGHEEGKEERDSHLSPTGWRAIEEVVGIGGHCAEVEATDLQELLLLWV